jgi:hypothetical protein
MAKELKLLSIPTDWHTWFAADNWANMAQDFDRAVISERVRANWAEFEQTQADVLRISKKLLSQIDALADPLVIDGGDTDNPDAEAIDNARIAASRRRARESEGLQCVAQALERVTKVRLLVLEGLTRPNPTEEDNPTHLPQKPLKPPLWLPTGKAAEYFGVGAKSLRAWMEKGLISTMITPGGVRRYDVNSVAEKAPIRPVGVNLQVGSTKKNKAKPKTEPK